MLDRQFEADEPNCKWVAYVNSIRTASGWLAVAAVLDLFSRRMVGWVMDSIFDTALVERALSIALAQRKPDVGLLHHSDRGCQYSSKAYQSFLKEHGMHVSKSRRGNCWDNTVRERFFGTLKRECVLREHFKTREKARTARFEYSTIGFANIRPQAISARFSLKWFIADFSVRCVCSTGTATEQEHIRQPYALEQIPRCIKSLRLEWGIA